MVEERTDFYLSYFKPLHPVVFVDPFLSSFLVTSLGMSVLSSGTSHHLCGVVPRRIGYACWVAS